MDKKVNETVANQLVLTEALLLENLNKVQEENNVPRQSELAGHHFSIEMETGTAAWIRMRSVCLPSAH